MIKYNVIKMKKKNSNKLNAANVRYFQNRFAKKKGQGQKGQNCINVFF